MSLTKHWSQDGCLSRVMLTHAPRQATVWLSFDVRQKQTMKTTWIIAALACVSFLISCKRRSEFHRDFPSIQPQIHVVDDSGSPVVGGRAKVITYYWYPSLFGNSKGKSYADEFPIKADGTAILALRRHHQITKQEIAVEVGGKTVFETRVDEDLDWAEFELEPREVHVVGVPALSPRRIYWRGQNVYEKKEYTIRSGNKSTQYSLLEGKFVDSGGDILFIVDRPSARDLGKFDKPVRLIIRPINGLLQRMSQHEVVFSLDGNIARWGDAESISLEAGNSRNWPAFMCNFGYSSRDGSRRALVSLHAHPVSERADEDARMSISIWSKVDLYENEK